MSNVITVKSFVNEQLGLEGRVLMIKGKYHVILRDTEADQPVGGSTVFPDRKRAEDYAKTIACVTP